MIRTINNTICSLLFQAQLPPSYWVEALHAATYLLNILPSSDINTKFPFSILFNKAPIYDHLRVFRCFCFPNLNHYTTHKLSPHSTPCLFLGYPTQHHGYRCLDLQTNKIIISRHVVFDEFSFPAVNKNTKPSSFYEFLDSYYEPLFMFRHILQTPSPNTLPSQQPLPPFSTTNSLSYSTCCPASSSSTSASSYDNE